MSDGPQVDPELLAFLGPLAAAYLRGVEIMERDGLLDEPPIPPECCEHRWIQEQPNRYCRDCGMWEGEIGG